VRRARRRFTVAVPAVRVRPARLRTTAVRGFVRFGVAFGLAALVAQVVFVGLAVELVVRRQQPAGDVVPFQLVGVAATAGLVFVVRWAGARILAGTEADR
jgi:uncharacterized membrane protein YedE/YeeE